MMVAMPPYRSIPLAFVRRPPEEMADAARAYADAMTARRTVRAFSTDPFPDQIVVDAVRAASSAPSGANQQPWTFVVVTDPELKRQIREAAEIEEKKSWGGRMSEEWRNALEPLGLDWSKPHLTDAPALIVVFAQPWSEEPSPEGPQRRKHYYVDESVGIAVGMLLSALHLGGLATLTHTPSPMAFLRRVLARPTSERAYVLIAVGYPTESAEVPDIRRKDLEQVLVRR